MTCKTVNKIPKCFLKIQRWFRLYTCSQPIRCLPFGKRQTEKEEILRMLDLGAIEPSSSPWSLATSPSLRCSSLVKITLG